MKKHALFLLPCFMALASCGANDAKAPTGQVVATIDGKEITIAELKQEMENLKTSGHPQENLQSIALQSLVTRKLLATSAREQKLDLVPANLLRQKKMEEMVLIDALTDETRKSVPPPSREEAEHYVDEHPASFAQRRMFILDQLIVLDGSSALVKKLEPLNSLGEISTLLDNEKIKYNKTVGMIDALNISAEVAEKMATLPPGAIFMTPDENGNLRVNIVRETVIQPLEREAAINIALETLRSKRSDKMVQNRIDEIVAANASKVKYNPTFKPKKSGEAGES